MAKIKHGFSGQRLIVYPFYVIEQPVSRGLGRTLYGVFSEGGKPLY